MSTPREHPPLVELGGRTALCLMAAEPEYGEALAARIRPLMIGVGPVEAAVGATRALAALCAAGRLPDLVLSLGSAGSRTLEQTRVYQVGAVSWRDMDASPLGFERGRTPFLDLPAVLALPFVIPGVPTATLSTGADIVSGTAYDTLGADMVDMETYAVLRACMSFGVPLVGLRGISDGAESLRYYEDWSACLPLVDRHLAEAVDRLADALADGTLVGAPGNAPDG